MVVDPGPDVDVLRIAFRIVDVGSAEGRLKLIEVIDDPLLLFVAF